MEFYSFLQGGALIPSTVQKSQTRTKSLINRFLNCGWDSSFLHERLGGLRDAMLRDYREEDMILGAVQSWYIERTTLLETFHSLGLQQTASEQLVMRVGDLENTCYTQLQLVEIAIEYNLGIFQSTFEPTTTHPRMPTLVLNPFRIQTNITGFNLPYRCYERRIPAVKDIVENTLRFKSFGYTLFYHTTSWTFAELILQELSHKAGRKCLDFGSTPGFYVGPSLADAVQWGEKNSEIWSYEVAILVFSIPDSLPDSIRWKDLEGDEWSSVMSFSRKCKYPTLSAPQIRGYDIVVGQMLANPQEVKMGYDPISHRIPKYQVASKTDNGDRFLQSCIRGCLYFQKYRQGGGYEDF